MDRATILFDNLLNCEVCPTKAVELDLILQKGKKK